MANDAIPYEVQQFLFERVDSVEMLEVLLLLRAHRGRSWSAREINEELRANETSVCKRLATLEALGIVAAADDAKITWRYAPRVATTETMLDMLAEAYRVRRHRVLEIVFSPMKRARNFADAFVVRGSSRKEDDDG